MLNLAHRIAPIGNPNAVSDAGVAAQLASASVRGAILNVRINLPYLPAESSVRETAAADATGSSARPRTSKPPPWPSSMAGSVPP